MNKVKVLIIGGGGREHALAHAFARSARCEKVFVSPGNAGIALEYPCVLLPDKEKIYDFCEKEGIGMVFIGPEQPIAEGLSDYLKAKGVRVIAPSQAAARLETSKAFAKEIMQNCGAPCAGYRMIHSPDEAKEILPGLKLPIVLKADGLAAGKGVIIAHSHEEAQEACNELLAAQCGADGVLAEEYLEGWEASLFVFTDSEGFCTTVFAQDHKQLLDGDEGPNTGGMGAYCPVAEAEPYRHEVEERIVAPVLTEMKKRGTPYFGVLYVGLMMTARDAHVIEFNCRFGDPEAQAVLPMLKTDFVELCEAMFEGKAGQIQLDWLEGSSVAVIMAAEGYPGDYKKSLPISIDELDGRVYYSGVAKGETGLISSGGRILAAVNKGENLKQAREKAYADIGRISIPQSIYRKDIGMRINRISRVE